MELTAVVAAFVDEISGGDSDLRRALDDFVTERGDRGAVAVARLRRRLAEMFLAEGWEPPAGLVVEEPAPPPGQAQQPQVEPVGVRAVLGTASGADDDLAALQAELVQLRAALQTRPVIDQAKGILMARFGLSGDAAWAYLVRESQRTNVKVRALAAEILATPQPTEVHR